MPVYILYYSDICPVAIIAAIQAAIQDRAFASSAVVAPIVLRVEEDIIIGSRVIISIAIVIALGVSVSVGVAIIVVITMCCLLRGCLLAGLFSLAKRVFTGFAL